MLAVLFYIFLAYLLFRFVFGFLVPIIRTTRQVKRGFREMNERMGSFGGQHPEDLHSAQAPGQRSQVNSKAPSKDDYIDFEEIKE
ncbi:hypothetical protein EPD60_06955 [Flaviaesturariibacter flavus]|uniref:DUF4834 family protein n=1 Tax=Flaviaesturariibacter flavus TaxID=2502780 RepID=A0A4R1BIE7_9BACT|nr:hypothetical protein [Flaviaesturariibacter flavus]TCJ17043.1 hypothetical protein EPD60_06955 [Flaviaesturariibacter flavus]